MQQTPRIALCLLLLPGTVVSAAEAEPAAETATGPGIVWKATKKWPGLGPIAFRVSDFPDDEFLLLFPEWITSREKNWHVDTKWESKGDSAVGLWKSEPYAVRIDLRFTRDEATRTLAWECRFTNGSDAALTDVAAFQCFNLADAPTFLDLEMQRTFVSRGSEPGVRLSDVPKTVARRTIQFYPARGGLPLTEFERFAQYGATSARELDGDRIGASSRDGRWTVQSIVEGRVAYFFNNWEPDHGCIHAAPLLGDVPAGKTGTARGRLAFSRRSAK